MRELYSALVGGGHVSRSEFWQMHPRECWWLISAKNPAPDTSHNEHLYDLLKNGFSNV